jgi:hypothetical protein
VLEQFVGQLGLGDRGSAAQTPVPRRCDRFEPLVDLGVDPADEERGDAVDRRRVAAAVDERLEAAQVGLDDLGVAGEGEDQRDVDAAALGDHRLDRGDALSGRRDLHEQVWLVDPLVQRTGSGDRSVDLPGQLGSDLHRHEAVGPVGPS